MISRSEVVRANHWFLVRKLADLFNNIHCNETSWPVKILLCVLPESSQNLLTLEETPLFNELQVEICHAEYSSTQTILAVA